MPLSSAGSQRGLEAGYDELVELAARIPAARLGGAVEVRPTMEW